MRKRHAAAGIVAGVAAGVAGLMLVAIMWQTYVAAERIESCTTPHGECAERQERRTENAIRRLNDFQRLVVTLAAVCADQPGTQGARQIAACIREGIERNER